MRSAPTVESEFPTIDSQDRPRIASSDAHPIQYILEKLDVTWEFLAPCSRHHDSGAIDNICGGFRASPRSSSASSNPLSLDIGATEPSAASIIVCCMEDKPEPKREGVIFALMALAIACACSQPALTTVASYWPVGIRYQSICNRGYRNPPQPHQQTVCHTDSSIIEPSPYRCPSNIGVAELTLKRELGAASDLVCRFFAFRP